MEAELRQINPFAGVRIHFVGGGVLCHFVNASGRCCEATRSGVTDHASSHLES